MEKSQPTISDAYSIYRKDGMDTLVKKTVKYAVREYFGSSKTVSFLDILIREKSLAIPYNHEWIIFDLDKRQVDRMIPEITEDVTRVRPATKEHQDLMLDTYTKDGFLEINAGDVIVDVGAYLGGFTIPAAKRGGIVFAVDPNAKISDSLSFNTCELNNVVVIPKAAWNKNEVISINQSLFPNDNSILEPDEDDIGESFPVEAVQLPKEIRSYGVTRIDLLKIDAEGVEPEILEHCLSDEMDIKKIVVDTTPERNGERTTGTIRKMLVKHGYQVEQSDDSNIRGSDIVYAKHN